MRSRSSLPVRRRHRRRLRTPAVASPFLLLLLCCAQHRPVGAGIFGQRKKADKEESKPEVDAKVGDIAAGKTGPAEGNAAQTESADDDGGGGSTAPSPTPSRPPSIVEAEARTARELAGAVGTLRGDLEACRARVDAMEEGFQSLYARHLGNVEGLRKCQEGVLTREELEKLDAGLDGVDPDLVEQARAKEEERVRRERTEALAERHRELIRDLKDQVEQLVRREKTWERTISELVARRDLLERREGAWERTIGDLMGDIEIRAKRESWWEEMKAEMEGRIGALSHAAVLERFGPGPHYVSIMVILDEENPSSQKEIILKMAPLELMPHSIHLFLSQIAEGYWSRGEPAIVINAGHVLQACPHPCMEGVGLGGAISGYPYAEMKVAGLDAVSFQEYSPQYPHKKYTIGFAGRPHSGPEFYINLMDNTLDHGTVAERKRKMDPDVYKVWAKEVLGGTDEADEKAIEPYPCFGKVIDGFDVVDKIAEGLTRTSLLQEGESEKENRESGGLKLDSNMLLRPVRIGSVTILKDFSPGEKRRSSTTDEL
ncbi:hypothetical protein ACHAWF_013967 [Thalassiosira exigua]